MIQPAGMCRPLETTGGLAMGVMDGVPYPSRRVLLRPNEILFAFTDGLTDAVNLKGEMFGKERLDQTLTGVESRTPEEIINHIWQRTRISRPGQMWSTT